MPEQDNGCSPPPATHTLVLPEIYTSKMACIYNIDGKRKGMLTPDRLQNILQKAYNKTKLTGLHKEVTHPTHSFTSELVRLLTRTTLLKVN